MLFPRPHVRSLDVRVYPVWNSTPSVSKVAFREARFQQDYLPQRATLRAPGGAVRIEVEVEFDAIEMNTLPALSLELCRHSEVHAAGCATAVIAAVSPLPLVSLDPHMSRARLPHRQRARAILGSDSELNKMSRCGDFYRLVLDDIPHAPPTGPHPWRFVSASQVLTCRIVLTSNPPLPPPPKGPRASS